MGVTAIFVFDSEMGKKRTFVKKIKKKGFKGKERLAQKKR